MRHGTIDDAIVADTLKVTGGLRTAVVALEEIAQIQAMCPLAAEIAVRALRDIKDTIAGEHYGQVLQDARFDEERARA